MESKRLTPYLRREVLALPLADRLALARAIRESVKAPRTDSRQRLYYLADKMAEVSGVDIRCRMDRTQDVVWPRWIFIYIARREGFSQNAIGSVISRDHATISKAEGRVADIFTLPWQYEKEIELYNKYVESL